jgi:hypothetical protein
MSKCIYTPSPNDEIFSYPHLELDYDDSDLELNDGAGPNNGFYGKNHTEDSKAEMSIKAKGRVNPFLGRTHTEESKAKMRKAKLNIKNPKLSAEGRANISKAAVTGWETRRKNLASQ